jgi:anion-transporting  ArsA/GET3 family ATPase
MKPIWEDRKVVVNVGTGGVGKTTVSAAMAVAAAASGRRTLVMTIDPARRLANALGLPSFGNVEHRIEDDQLAPYGVKLKAPLWAMMPDVKRTFDELVERFAPNDEKKRAILGNRIYQHFSTVLVGSHEYAAVEKLHEVYASGRYDLIVLDTPPSGNAVDFLEAPSRIIDFLEQDTVQWLVKPYAAAGRFSLKLLDVGSSFISKSVGKLAGADTLRELAEFVLGFQGMYEGFRERSRRVRDLLASDEVAFNLVSSTQRAQHDAMFRFREELAAEGLKVRALVVNCVRDVPPGITEPKTSAAVRAALKGLTPGAADQAERALHEEAALARIDRDAVEHLAERLGHVRTILLPELASDVHDLASLSALHPYFLESAT